MDYFNQAKTLKLNEPEIVTQLSIWLFQRGLKKDAYTLMNEQLAKEPGNPKVLADGVYLFLLLGEKEKSKPLLVKLKQLSPADPITIKMAGVLAEQEGRLMEALNLYEKSFKAGPGDLSTIKYLGMVYLREEMWQNAITLFRKALEYHPNEPYLLEGLGRILVTCPDFKLRNINEGREYSERAFYRFTSPPLTQISAGINLSMAYAQMGEKQRASSYINKTVSLAIKANVSKEYLEYLENLSNDINSAGENKKK
jgi:Flp pilus assembly protein TadD